MSTLDGWYVPGLDAAAVERWHTLVRGGVRVRSPILNADQLTHTIGALRAAREAALVTRSARDIAAALAGASELLLETATRDDALEALAALTGYSVPMVRTVIGRMAEDWRQPALQGLLDAELAGGGALDRFIARSGRPAHSMAVGPTFSVHIFSGNVPGVAITSIVRALLVRSAVLGKMASGEPLLAALFARAVERVDVALARCIAVLYWPGGGSPMEEAALAEADTVIVYGSGEAIRAVRGRAAPDARIIEHGPRYSIGLVGREVLARDDSAAGAAQAAALATALFDQQGCVSPHAIWVEGDAGAAGRFAGLLAAALESLAATLPRGALDAAAAVQVRSVRTGAEFRGLAGEDIEVLPASAEGAGWTVIREATDALRPSPLYRTITVHPIASLADAPALLAPWGARLHTVALAVAAERRAALAPAFARAGAGRITDFERMPWPSAAGHHDGRGPLTELVRWVDLE